MKNLNRTVRSVMMMGAFLLLASSASAQFTPPTRPSQCSDSRNSSGWTAGKTAADSRVTSVWRSAAVNQNLDNLSDKLPVLLDSLQTTLVSLVNGTGVTQYTRCRAQGYIDGFVFRLTSLFGACVLDGATWGQTMADTYCDISAEFGGLGEIDFIIRNPVGLCGNLFESSCEDVYQYVAKNAHHTIDPVVQSYLTQQSFVPVPSAACEEYTQNEFTNVFFESLNNECAYNPAH